MAMNGCNHNRRKNWNTKKEEKTKRETEKKDYRTMNGDLFLWIRNHYRNSRDSWKILLLFNRWNYQNKVKWDSQSCNQVKISFMWFPLNVLNSFLSQWQPQSLSISGCSQTFTGESGNLLNKWKRDDFSVLLLMSIKKKCMKHFILISYTF